MNSFLHIDSDSHFSLQNIPFGVVSLSNKRRPATRIGDTVVDLRALEEAGVLALGSEPVFSGETLNGFLALSRAERSLIRERIQSACSETSKDKELVEKASSQISAATPVLPFTIGDYTDFYASRWHASNVGKMFRPDGEPLLPNWLHLPVGYHGRSSTVVISGTPVRRPSGQILPKDSSEPIDAPCRLLDYEFEMGVVYGGASNALGERITLEQAEEHLAGMLVVNDWSARDIQKWEYQPLGPFNAKNFQTSVSPWLVTMDALEPFRTPLPARGPDDPELLPYLKPANDQGYDIHIETFIQSPRMNEPFRIARGNFKDMWWSFAQMLTHHSSTGCQFRAGDLLASGTVSGPEKESRGCLLERTWRGTEPIELPDGTSRTFLQDGDKVILTAHAEKDGVRVGFGEVEAEILASS